MVSFCEVGALSCPGTLDAASRLTEYVEKVIQIIEVDVKARALTLDDYVCLSAGHRAQIQLIKRPR